MAFEDRLKEARKAAGLTQEQAAEQIGVAKSTWTGYEKGNSQPDINKIVKIMAALNIDANYLWQDYGDTTKAPTEQELKNQAIDKLLGNVSKLTPENQERLTDYLALLIQSQK